MFEVCVVSSQLSDVSLDPPPRLTTAKLSLKLFQNNQNVMNSAKFLRCTIFTDCVISIILQKNFFVDQGNAVSLYAILEKDSRFTIFKANLQKKLCLKNWSPQKYCMTIIELGMCL